MVFLFWISDLEDSEEPNRSRVRGWERTEVNTVRSWWTGANAVRVKCLTMYSNIISWRPHHGCDVTLGTIFSYGRGRGCERDGDALE